MALCTRIGGAESDSLVTVAEADDIVQNHLPDDPTAWLALTTAQKEYRLKLGAQLLSYLPLRGRKVYCTQALPFPRTCQGVVHSIPDEVKHTQVFLAYSVIHRGLANRPTDVAEEESGAAVSQVSLGGLLTVAFRGTAVEAGNALDKVMRSSQSPAYLMMKRWLSQVRGGTVLNDDEISCSTTSTTSTTTSTSTSSSTSTTTT